MLLVWELLVLVLIGLLFGGKGDVYVSREESIGFDVVIV